MTIIVKLPRYDYRELSISQYMIILVYCHPYSEERNADILTNINRDMRRSALHKLTALT